VVKAFQFVGQTAFAENERRLLQKRKKEKKREEELRS
jgi:hypothetical protein